MSRVDSKSHKVGLLFCCLMWLFGILIGAGFVVFGVIKFISATKKPTTNPSPFFIEAFLMNKIFKVKRNSAGQSVVTSEIAKSHGRVLALAVAAAITSHSAIATTVYSTTTPEVKFDDENTILIGSDLHVETETAYNSSNISIGNKSKFYDLSNSISIGNNNILGDQSTLNNGNQPVRAVAIGSDNKVGHQSIGIGGGTVSNSPFSIAIGDNGSSADEATTATGFGSIAIGGNAKALIVPSPIFDATRNIAIGSSSFTNAKEAIAFGYKANATHDKSVALGSNSVTEAPKSTPDFINNGIKYTFSGRSSAVVSIGDKTDGNGFNRQIVNVAAGRVSDASTDAVNGSQLYAAISTLGNVATSAKNILGGDSALAANGTISMTNIGGTGQNTIHDAIAFVNAKQGGAAVNVVQGDGVTVTNATVNGEKTFTVGLSDATKANITKAQTDAAKGIADAKVADDKAVAAQNTANTAVTKADAAQATADKAAKDIKALDDIAVKYDTTTKDKVTLGGANGTTITNVKDGAITADSKDAVNGGQLYALTEKVNNLDATDVVAGKGTTVTKSTQGNLNTYTVSVSDETLDNIAKAQTDAAKGIADAKAADDKAVAAQNTANTAVTKADAAQATADKATEDIKALDDIAVKYDTTTKDKVTLGGANGTTITNVKDGAITADSKDAVNGSQLHAVKVVADAAKAQSDANTADIARLDNQKADKTALDATNDKLNALDNAAVKYDDPTTKDKVTLGGADGTTITNVKAGAISANSTDAVNGSQLFDVYNYVNQGNDAMRQHIDTVEDKLQAGIAGSNASAALPQVRGNGKSMMAFGLGGFQDKGALAVGYSRSSDNGRTVFKAHLNADTEKQIGGGIGLGFEW